MSEAAELLEHSAQPDSQQPAQHPRPSLMLAWTFAELECELKRPSGVGGKERWELWVSATHGPHWRGRHSAPSKAALDLE